MCGRTCLQKFYCRSRRRAFLFFLRTSDFFVFLNNILKFRKMMKIIPLALLAPCFLSFILIECQDGPKTSPPISLDDVKNDPSRYYAKYLGMITDYAEQEAAKLYYSFICAMLNFKTTTDVVFQRFHLNSMKNIPAKKMPEKMYLHIRKSDKLVKKDGQIVVVKLEAEDVRFAKWYKLVTCAPTDASCIPYVDNFTEPLQTKLDEYYRTHDSQLKKAPYPITDLQTFYEFFAITMQRVYLLGCLFDPTTHGIYEELQKFTSKDENNDFIEVFHRILPGWSLTQLEIDLVNLAWLEGGLKESQLLKVGYDLGDTYKNLEGKVIPVSDNCLKASFTKPTTPSA